MSFSSFIHIDDTIKQQFLPFLLNADGIEYPQVFSFKNVIDQDKIPAGKLNICPKSIEQYITEDISFKSIFPKRSEKSSFFDINSLYDSIPSLQIREFLPDTKLDQAINFFSGIFTAIQDAFTSEKTNGTNDNSKKFEQININSKDFYDKITKVATHAIKFMTGMTDPDFYDAMSSSFWSQANNKLQTFKNLDSDVSKYVLSFPYTMWYLLQSSRTTNIYELPGITEDKELYRANGHAGWEGSAGFSLVGDDGVFSKFFSGNIAGKIINTLLGNVNISFMPWWDAKKGNATPFTDVKIKIDLFNDRAEAAAKNFIFVNTIIPNAKWIQYNIFQHSPCIYDIKLDGYKRLYACSGDFTVKQGGILRDITEKWFNDNLDKYINDNAMNRQQFKNYILSNKLIKIPDVYHVEMTFKSLLPDTFNNFLYQYSSSNIIQNDKFPPRHNSTVLDSITGGIKALGEELKKKWNE